MSAVLSHYNLAIIIQEQRRGQAVQGLKRDLHDLKQQVGTQNAAQKGAAKSTGEWTDKTQALSEKIRRALVPALLLATGAMAKFALDGVREFAQFDQKLHETFTLMPQASEGFKAQVTDDIRAVGLEYGKLTDETVPALYQALSAGLPKENALAGVEIASKAAIAGVADTVSTMKTGMAVVNAYGGEIYDLDQAYDILFQMVRYGVLTMRDLNRTLSTVTSVASETRTPLEDIGAALVVMTRQGDSAAEATELLSLFLMQLGTDGTAAFEVFREAAGMTYREWIAQGHGLIEALNLLDQYAQDTGKSLSAMIAGDSRFYRDQQAARASLELTGLHLETLNEIAQKFTLQEYAGAMDVAFEEASDNAQFQIDQMTAEWENLKIEIGEAIWVSDFFFGKSGEQMVQYAKDFVRLISGSWKLGFDFAQGNEPIETIGGVLQKLNELQGIRTKMKITGAEQEWKSLYEGQIFRLAELTHSHEDFYAYLQGANLLNKNLWSPDQVKYLELATGQLWQRAQAAKEMAANDLELAKAEAELNEELQRSFIRRDPTSGIIGDITQSYDELFAVGPQFQSMTQLFQEAADAGTFTAEAVHWVAVETHALSDSVAAYFENVQGPAAELFDAWETFGEASGDWVETIVDNESLIQDAYAKLSQDLTDEQKDQMWDIVKNIDAEGGAEWRAAWEALQSDLTTTQRAELVAQIMDLQNAAGEKKSVYTGDAEAMEEAAGRVFEALNAIDEAHNNLATSIAEENIIERFGEQTREAAQAILDYKLASGEISPEEHAFLSGELDLATELKEVLDPMWEKYLADGQLTKTELDNIATATETVKEKHENLTTEGLQAYLDKALSESGGYPYVAGVIRDDVTGAVTGLGEESSRIVEEGPYEPAFDIDKTSFDTTYGNMMTEINKALGPWTIKFKIQYDEISPPSPSPQVGHASGVSDAIVPPGYPNDSYLVGLTSGERYTVTPPGQPHALGGNFIDQSQMNITIHNNSAGAAALTRAWLEKQKAERVDAFMGK